MERFVCATAVQLQHDLCFTEPIGLSCRLAVHYHGDRGLYSVQLSAKRNDHEEIIFFQREFPLTMHASSFKALREEWSRPTSHKDELARESAATPTFGVIRLYRQRSEMSTTRLKSLLRESKIQDTRQKWSVLFFYSRDNYYAPPLV